MEPAHDPDWCRTSMNQPTTTSTPTVLPHELPSHQRFTLSINKSQLTHNLAFGMLPGLSFQLHSAFDVSNQDRLAYLENASPAPNEPNTLQIDQLEH